MSTEHDSLNNELDQILEELGVTTTSDDDNEALSMLSAELDGTEFDMGESADVMTMLGIDDDPEMQELGVVARTYDGLSLPLPAHLVKRRPRTWHGQAQSSCSECRCRSWLRFSGWESCALSVWGR
ncbi:hypothetical protein BD293_3902 [Roseinatronobacter monicus]|uniref:Uncharacterized protein n=1 Tax=Roseinatronobacter monicus TaxID=393481 RepID=A0A543K610_9RHOB|nr:hypothetical protein BD293_3902 [Roseinatronobacter monicus]